MVAALANFSIYVVPLTLDIACKGAGFRIKLYQMGFKIMDSYDFEADQDLGYWDEATSSASGSWTYAGTKVTNRPSATGEPRIERAVILRSWDVKHVTTQSG